MADSLSVATGTDVHLQADEETVELSLLGMGGCAFQISGTYTGTITFEGTVNGGEWAALLVVPIGTTASTTTTTGTGIFRACTVGLLAARARMSSYSDGYATVMIRAVSASSIPVLT